jgi:ElaB/YqjD/DUF883 family membrane-anchored ribosome-binding protein
MNTDNITQNVDQLGQEFQQARQTVENAADEAVRSVRTNAESALCCASESIRKNPIPIVVGAAAFGVAIGCLIMSGRHTPNFQERYLTEPLDHAGDALTNSWGKLIGNIKFW